MAVTVDKEAREEIEKLRGEIAELKARDQQFTAAIQLLGRRLAGYHLNRGQLLAAIGE